jgi:multiple sugar transport system permease protein
VTLSTIGGFQLFIEPYILTGGGPLRRTLSVVLYMYRNAFSYQKMGYAATLGLALALIIAVVLVVQRRIIGSAEEA